MFATSHSPWIERLRRAAALVKAFALLEEPPRSAPSPASTPVHPAATHTRAAHRACQREPRVHPHRAALVAPTWDRRPGAPPRPVQPCTMPLVKRVAGGERSRA
jgi:hypothetical protein